VLCAANFSVEIFFLPEQHLFKQSVYYLNSRVRFIRISQLELIETRRDFLQCRVPGIDATVFHLDSPRTRHMQANIWATRKKKPRSRGATRVDDGLVPFASTNNGRI